ncbi:NAD(P)-dependent oxidoreductase [Stappia sp.]|uniref:NAD(P)-dependent oxidoreductase n=1 Tax=Stappia sp. TaxID=1870903 RepID=UPI003C7E0AA2
MAKAAFIGLGVMGYPMAGYLASKGGHDVTVYNRTAAKAEKWVAEHGGRHAATPEEAARDCDFVFACVGNDDDLRSVTIGEGGAFHGMKPGAIFIDNTTASAEVARELHAAAAERGCGFLDAPVSGGQAGAENGALTVMVGGDEAHYEAARPAIECFAKMVGLMGPSGSGQLTKMVNQICIAGLVQGLSEAIHFAKSAALDVAKVIDVISKGAAQSWQMENRWETMRDGKFDFGFAVDWMRKDLGICLKTANETGARLPVTALVDQFYAEVQGMGGHRWDTSSLIARLENADRKG